MIRYLYGNTVPGFLKDVDSGEYVEILKNKFLSEIGHRPSQSEVNSWQSSSRALADLLKGLDNVYIASEVILPYSSSRVDYMLFGRNADGKETVMVIEMKGWTDARPSFAKDYVRVRMAQGWEDHLHPSIQVQQYVEYLKSLVSFANRAVMIGVSYTYNAHIDYLYDHDFSQVLSRYPLFDRNTKDRLRDLIAGLNYGGGYEVFQEFVKSPVAPQKGLIEELEKAIEKGNLEHFDGSFVLLDDQIAVYNTVLEALRRGEKAVIIVEGGPGTGKSVIALSLLARVLKDKKNEKEPYIAFYVTGSKAFTTTLRKVTHVHSLFKFFNSFSREAEKSIDVIDLLIADEAHRIRKKSTTRYIRNPRYSQTEELIRVARVSAFFIDPYQRVRPGEVGDIGLIESIAKKYNAKVYKFTLEAQFRSNGSQAYIDWVDNLLGIRKTETEYYTDDFGVEFKIFDDPESLRQEIMKKNGINPNSARLVAGFCWEWSDPNPDGTLPEDIVIEYGNGKTFRATWEAKSTAKRLAKGAPPAELWAYDPAGVNQVGSIYTIQGFEFDYVGVLWCKDLVYNQERGSWEAHPENSADPAIKNKSPSEVLDLLKNTYRTLLTRGRRGVYVYFLDDGTRKYIESKLRSK